MYVKVFAVNVNKRLKPSFLEQHINSVNRVTLQSFWFIFNMLKNKDFKLSEAVFIMLINVKMPTIVDILTFMSMINFMINQVEHVKKLYKLWARSIHTLLC